MKIVFKQSPKKQVSALIAWLCSFCYIGIVALVVIFFFTDGLSRVVKVVECLDFSMLNSSDLIIFGIILLTCIFLIFCLNFFEWFLNPVLEKKNEKLIFKTDDVIAALGKSTTVTTILDVKKYQEKKNSIIVYGDIIVKEPMSKTKNRNKCEIVGLYDKHDKEQVKDLLKELING